MTSSRTDTRLREAARATRQAARRLEADRPDVDQLVGRAARRRWFRTGSRAAVGLAAAAALTLIVITRPPSSPAPEILGDPTAPASPELDDVSSPAADDGGATADGRAAAEGRWLHGSAGDGVELDRNALAALDPATGDPIVVPWSSDVVDAVEAATTAHTSPDGAEEELFRLQGAVDQTGAVLVASMNGGGDLIHVEPATGTSRLLDEALRRISSVEAVPAGGWLVSAVDGDGQAILLKVADDGDEVDRVELTPAPPRGGGLLEVVGLDVWLVNSFESVDLDRGPQATLVSDDGGATLNPQVAWQRADEAVPEDEFVDLLDVDARQLASAQLDGGRVTIDWVGAPIRGTQSLVPVHITDSRLVVGRIQRMFHGSDDIENDPAALPHEPNVDILIVVTDDQVHVGRLEPGQTTDRSGTTITSSPDGRLWHLTFDASAVTLREILLPTTDRGR